MERARMGLMSHSDNLSYTMSKPFIDEFELRKIAAYKLLDDYSFLNYDHSIPLSVEDINRLTKDYFICTTCNEAKPPRAWAMPRMCATCYNMVE